MEQTNNAFARSTTHCKYLLTDSESADLAKVLHLGRRHRSKVLEYRAVATLDALVEAPSARVGDGLLLLGVRVRGAQSERAAVAMRAGQERSAVAQGEQEREEREGNLHGEAGCKNCLDGFILHPS